MPRKSKLAADAAAPAIEEKKTGAAEPVKPVEPVAESVKPAEPAVKPASRAGRRAKAAPKARKAAEKTVEEEILVQYAGAEWDVSVLKEKAIGAFVAEGHQRGRIHKLALYVKPEEHRVYYVVNDKTTGSVDFN